MIGFHTMLSENLEMPFKTQVLGVEVQVEKLDVTDDKQIAVICTRGEPSQRISSSTCRFRSRRLRARNGSTPIADGDVGDSSDRKDRLPVLFSAYSADSNKPQSIDIVAARAIENKRKLIDLCDRWVAPIAKPLAYEQAPLWAQILIRSRSGGDLALTSHRGGAFAELTAGGPQVLRLLILAVAHH